MKGDRRRIAVDTSIFVAIIRDEGGQGSSFSDILDAHEFCVGTPTVLELMMVLRGRFGAVEAQRLLDEVLNMPNLRLVAFGGRHMQAAMEAFARFGKGTGHAAGLNFGDCLAYAIAKVEGVPLLFKGEDFAQTDVESALL